MPFTVLFVDDEPQILVTLAAAFNKDYNVFTATNAAAAIEIVKKNKINVIVSDQRMPEITGIELLQQVKTISPNSMRILLTGYADLDAIIGAVNVGDVFRFVNKPWKNDKLRETISFACELSEKTFKVNVENQLIQTADHNDLFKDYHVLFVDTNPVHLAAFKEMFSGEYALHTAATAEDAFATARSTKVSVVVTDSVIRSNKGPLDTVDFLNAMHTGFPDIVSVYLGDSHDAVLAIRLINEGQIFRYLIKPFKRESLKQTVKDAVKRFDSNAKRPHSVTSHHFTESVKAAAVSSAGRTGSAPSGNIYDAIAQARERLKNRSGY